ncbi:MAG: gliding motility protein [Pseudomonadota bacterium]
MASSFVDSAAARQLRQTIDWHLANIASDTELTQRLEGMATQRAFGGMAWYWGPKLHARNRAAFRPFILNHFSDAALIDTGPWPTREPIAWAGAQAASLEPWLAAVDQADDVVLFRRLYGWKHRHRSGWGVDEAAWNRDVAERFASAGTAARRARALDKLDLHVHLSEATARQLYDIDRTLARPFILKHLPPRGWRDNADKRWRGLIEQALAGGDRGFAFDLYRRQVPLDRWRDEVMALARSIQPPAELQTALEERHPQGLWSDLGPVYVALLEARGADVLPYVHRHMDAVWSWGGGRDSGLSLARLAKARGWVDFRIAVLVKCTQAKAWNDGLLETLDDRALDEPERLRRLALFSGVSREWNFIGWGLASVQQLDPGVALKLYERYPALLRHQFKAHVTPAWGDDYVGLFERAWAAGDDDLADLLASRYLTRGMWGRPDAKELAPAERVADLLVALKLDPRRFVRRAAAILTRVPAYAIRDYAQLVRNNRLARLLFERSLKDFLEDSDGAAVRDLVEGSEIHVQRLAYRVLGLPDPRARRLAADNLDILIGTLLRPLHRETRLQAFAALKNAASEEAGARRVLARAREAFALPDKHYPKEGLLDLVAHIVARHPALAETGEARVIHRKAA